MASQVPLLARLREIPRLRHWLFAAISVLSVDGGDLLLYFRVRELLDDVRIQMGCVAGDPAMLVDGDYYLRRALWSWSWFWEGCLFGDGSWRLKSLREPGVPYDRHIAEFDALWSVRHAD